MEESFEGKRYGKETRENKKESTRKESKNPKVRKKKYQRWEMLQWVSKFMRENQIK